MGLKVLYQSADLSQYKHLVQVDLGFSYLFHACLTGNYLFNVISTLKYLFQKYFSPPSLEFESCPPYDMYLYS